MCQSLVRRRGIVFGEQWVVWVSRLRDRQTVFCKRSNTRYLGLRGPRGLCGDAEGHCFSTCMSMGVSDILGIYFKGMKPSRDDMTLLELGRHPVSPSCLLSCLLCGLSHAIYLRCLIFSDQSKHSPKQTPLPWTCPCRAEGAFCVPPCPFKSPLRWSTDEGSAAWQQASNWAEESIMLNSQVGLIMDKP